MSDPATVAGKATETITLGGKTYTLHPYVVGMWGEMRDFVRHRKGDPIKELCTRLDSIPPAQQERWMKAALETASRQTPTDEEILTFEKSLLGRAFGMWCSLKQDHLADFPTAEKVYDAIVLEAETNGEKALSEILLKLHLASGEAALKNSVGRSTNTPASTPATETPSSEVGPASTSSLPTSTVGP
jgi:hypothetical protein